jgi:hypothetical protein
VRLAGGGRWPEKGGEVARVVIRPTLDRFLAVVRAVGLPVMAGGGARVFHPPQLIYRRPGSSAIQGRGTGGLSGLVRRRRSDRSSLGRSETVSSVAAQQWRAAAGTKEQ